MKDLDNWTSQDLTRELERIGIIKDGRTLFEKADAYGLKRSREKFGHLGPPYSESTRAQAIDYRFQQSDRYVVNEIKKLGYDGIVYKNEYEGGGDSYIVFDPNQIKSIYNKGDFDRNNSNIRYSMAG